MSGNVYIYISEIYFAINPRILLAPSNESETKGKRNGAAENNGNYMSQKGNSRSFVIPSLFTEILPSHATSVANDNSGAKTNNNKTNKTNKQMVITQLYLYLQLQTHRRTHIHTYSITHVRKSTRWEREIQRRRCWTKSSVLFRKGRAAIPRRENQTLFEEKRIRESKSRV